MQMLLFHNSQVHLFGNIFKMAMGSKPAAFSIFFFSVTDSTSKKLLKNLLKLFQVAQRDYKRELSQNSGAILDNVVDGNSNNASKGDETNLVAVITGDCESSHNASEETAVDSTTQLLLSSLTSFARLLLDLSVQVNMNVRLSNMIMYMCIVFKHKELHLIIISSFRCITIHNVACVQIKGEGGGGTGGRGYAWTEFTNQSVVE